MEVEAGLAVPILLLAALGVAALELRRRRSAERAAAERSALLAAILDSMSEGVSVVDRDGKVVLVNETRRKADPSGLVDVPARVPGDAVRFFGPDGHSPLAESELPLARALRGESGSVEFVRGAPGSPGGRYEHIAFRPLVLPGRKEPAGALVVVRDETERRANDRARQEYLIALQDALADIRTLRGVLPICSSCKKIRNDEGAWLHLEAYVHEHTEADFSHGICPECLARLYPEFDDTGRGDPKAPG